MGVFNILLSQSFSEMRYAAHKRERKHERYRRKHNIPEPSSKGGWFVGAVALLLVLAGNIPQFWDVAAVALAVFAGLPLAIFLLTSLVFFVADIVEGKSK